MLITPRSVAALSKKRPLFDFNFIFNQSLDPRISFSRTTIGTRFNSAGLLVTENPDVPRFDYDPATLSALGLLVEPQRTNLFLQSEALDDAAWVKAGSSVIPTVTANDTTAPDGAISADSVAYLAVSTGYSVVYQRPAQAPGSYVVSSFLKGVNGTEVVWLAASPNATIYSRTQAALTTSWQRFSVGYTETGTDYYNQLGVDLRDPQQTAQPAQSIYAWGAQLEAGTFPTSYIPTTTATVTRTADVPQITIPQPADILVQDREGGAWITGIPAGPYTLAPRTDKRHIARWRAFPAGYAAAHPELAVAYP